MLRLSNYDQTSGNYWNKFIAAFSNFFQCFFYCKKILFSQRSIESKKEYLQTSKKSKEMI